MAFTVPEFPIVCNIYTGPWLGKVLRLSDVPCNLAWGKRVNALPQINANADLLDGTPQMTLLLPALTDVRSTIISGTGDVVEIPSGSARWYGVLAVDDIGKGFPNEHRGAYVLQISKYVDSIAYAGLTPPVPWP